MKADRFPQMEKQGGKEGPAKNREGQVESSESPEEVQVKKQPEDRQDNKKEGSESAGDLEKSKIEDNEKPLSTMEAAKVNQMATQAFLDLTSEINFYIREIGEVDPVQEAALENRRSSLRREIAFYFNEKNPVLPQEGFVSQEIETDLRVIAENATKLVAEARVIYEKCCPPARQQEHFGGEVSKVAEIPPLEKVSTSQKDQEETSGNNPAEPVITDPRPTRPKMIVSDEEKALRKAAPKKSKSIWRAVKNFTKGIFSAKKAQTAKGLEIPRASSVDQRPTRVNMPSWEEELKARGLEDKADNYDQKSELSAKQESRERAEGEKIEKKETFKLKSQHRLFESPKHPDVSQDAFINDAELGIFGVFDGMGGYKGGEVAAETAKEVAYNYISLGLKNIDSMEAAKKLMADALEQANRAILETKANSEKIRKMGTTGTLSFVFQGHLITGHLGDSRNYLFREGELKQLTEDDGTVPEDILEKYDFDNITNPQRQLQDDPVVLQQCWVDGRKRVSKFLGQDKIEPTVFAQEIKKGDRLLFSSDGLHDNLTREEIAGYIRKSDFAGMAMEANRRSLADYRYAEEHSGAFNLANRYKYDDIVGVMVEID